MKATNQIGTADLFNQPMPKGRRPMDRPDKKGKDFGAMLKSPAKSSKDLAYRGERNRPVKADESSNQIREKIESKQDWNQRPTVKKPSRAIRSWGRRLAKDAGGLARFPALSFLGGQQGPKITQKLPEMLSQENSFLAKALGSDTKVLMHSQFKLGDLADMLGLSESFNAEAEKLGLDPNEVVSPKQLFQSLGIDPHRVISEVDRLKEQLAKNGLGSYLQAQPNQKPQKHKKAPAGQDFAMEARPKGKSKTLYPVKKISQTPELNNLWQNPSSAEPSKAPLKPQEKGTSPFTNLETKQIQNMQGKHVPITNHLNPLESRQLNTQRQAFVPTTGAPQSFDKQSLQALSNSMAPSKAPQASGLNHHALSAKQDKQQTVPGMEIPLNPLPLKAQNKGLNTPLIKDTSEQSHLNQTIDLHSLSQALPKREIQTTLQAGQMLNKSLQQEAPSNPMDNINIVQQGFSNTTATKQSSNNALNHPSIDSDLDVAINYKQPLVVDQFESVQRQLKNPFSQKELINTEKEGPEDLAELETIDPPKLASTDLRPKETPKSHLNPMHSAKRMTLVRNLLDGELDQTEQLKSIKIDDTKASKPKAVTENFEAPDLDTILNSKDPIKPAFEASNLPEMQPEMSQEAKQEMIDKVAEQSLLLNSKGGGRANIAISDKNFGEVSLAVHVDGSNVQLKMQSPSEQLRNLLGQDIGNLKETLSGQNLNLVQVDVSNNEYGHESHQHANNFQFYEGQQNPFSNESGQKTPLQRFKQETEAVIGSSKISRNIPDMSHNLLSKHIQVAA
ncbi:MAG: flagellar hook-length control protein FliK [Oligoflexales bacterium]|nr:flagellar hook-length control protein FliK [Oligoflexales bacterium]